MTSNKPSCRGLLSVCIWLKKWVAWGWEFPNMGTWPSQAFFCLHAPAGASLAPRWQRSDSEAPRARRPPTTYTGAFAALPPPWGSLGTGLIGSCCGSVLPAAKLIRSVASCGRGFLTAVTKCVNTVTNSEPLWAAAGKALKNLSW